MDAKIKDRILGCLLGSACANSLGGSAVGLFRKDILQAVGAGLLRDFSPGLLRSIRPDHEPGTILADTYLAMAVIESVLAANGKFDGADLKSRFAKLLEDPCFLKSSPGALCLAALRRTSDGEEPLDDASPEALHDSGAVRAYPLGLLPDAIDYLDIAQRQAKLTHADGRVAAAACVLAASVHGFVRGEELNSEQDVRKYVQAKFEIAKAVDERFADAWDYVAPDLDYAQPAHDLPYSLVNIESEVSEAVPTAVGIFLIFRHNLEEAVIHAASAGGDTDTIASVVGALAGAYHGKAAIPERWLANLSEREHLELICEQICRLW